MAAIYWCTKIMKLPAAYWKPNMSGSWTFLMLTASFVLINFHGCWTRDEWKLSISYKNYYIDQMDKSERQPMITAAAFQSRDISVYLLWRFLSEWLESASGSLYVHDSIQYVICLTQVNCKITRKTYYQWFNNQKKVAKVRYPHRNFLSWSWLHEIKTKPSSFDIMTTHCIENNSNQSTGQQNNHRSTNWCISTGSWSWLRLYLSWLVLF